MKSDEKLCYSMIQKRDRILEYKEKLTKLLRHMYLGYLGLCFIMISFIVNSKHFNMSFTMSEKLFPNLRKIDYWLIILACGLAIYLAILSGNFKRMKLKYEILRHDIMKDLDAAIITSKLCRCNGECECRESFIKLMDSKGIDLIFKKFKPEQKFYL